MGRSLAERCVAVVVAPILLATALAGCNTLGSVADDVLGGPPSEGTPGHVTGFLGGVVADEPRAALVGREVLSTGGSAADAAVAIGFAMAVTLPSRAGLGGGGACLAYAPSRDSVNEGVPEAILFAPPPGGAGGDRPAAVPMLARGLFALHARYGHRQFESLVSAAESMARFGVPVSRAFARDLSLVAGALVGDPGARAAFFRQGRPLGEGETMTQGDLGATLAQLRTAGVGDLHQGVLARRLAEVTPAAGGGLTPDALRAALPKVAAPLTLPGTRGDRVAFPPLPADGGAATAAAYLALQASPGDLDGAQSRALGVASLARTGGLDLGADPAAALSRTVSPGGLPSLPASASFATLDRDGNAVVCALTMNNLFGTGRVARGTGILLAASPATNPPPLLALALDWNPNVRGFRAAAAGTGQAAAPLAAAFALAQALADRSSHAAPLATPPPEPGRANVIECTQLLPGEEGSCGWAADPRGAGLAAGSN